MAILRDFAVTEYGTATIASLPCNMPVHETNDILIYFASKDGTPAINATAAWNAIQDGASTGAAYRVMWKLAASSAETLTVVTGTAENFCVVVVSIKGADTVNPIVVSAESGADDAAMPFAGPTATTSAETNCLIFHAWFTDSGLSPTAYAPLTNIYAGDNGANSTGVAYTYQRTAGSIPAASWFGRANDDGRGVVLAVKDGSSEAEISPYSDSTISSGQVLKALVGAATTESDSWPASLTELALGREIGACYRDVGPGVFTDYTTAARNTTTADVVFPTAGTDFMYFGHASTFRRVTALISTAGVGSTLTWEYYNGSTWATLPGVTTQNFTATGWLYVEWNYTVSNWATTAVNGTTLYWVRANLAGTYTTGIVATQVLINGVATTYDAAAAQADAGTNPYTDGTAITAAVSTTNLVGPQLTFGAALDMDTGIIYTSTRPTLPRDAAVDPGQYDAVAGGMTMVFRDTNGNYLGYTLMAKRCSDYDINGRNVHLIDWNGSATAWAQNGTINKSAVTGLYMLARTVYGQVDVGFSMLMLATRFGIAGGTSTVPLTFENLAYAMNNSMGLFPFMQVVGTACTLWLPLQLGGGDPIRIECNLNTFQFPRLYNGIQYFSANCATNVLGMKFYPKSGDVIKFTNCVSTSQSTYRWEFDASSASSGWTGDFSGSSVVNATVTLRNVFSFTGMTFIDCPTFTQNAAPLVSCNFDNTKVTATNIGAISNCSFTSGGTGHAIEIPAGSAGTYNFSGNTFTGYASVSGSTGNEAIYNNTGDQVTINVIGGGGSFSIRNSAGSTTTINNYKTLTLTGIVVNSEVRILLAGTTTEVAGSEDVDSGTFEYSYNYVAGTYVDIVVHSLTHQYYRIEDYLLTNGDASLPINQVIDRNYSNP